MILRYCTAIMTESLLLWVQSHAQAEAIPAAVKPCLRQLNTRRTPVSQVVTQGMYRARAKSYYLLSLYPANLDLVRDAVVSSTPTGCQVHAITRTGEPVDAAAAMPTAVARGLALSTLKTRISRAGGPQKYQVQIISLAQQVGNRLVMMPDEAWALHQLGIRIPPPIKIISP